MTYEYVKLTGNGKYTVKVRFSNAETVLLAIKSQL